MYWKTRQGKKIQISDMSNRHIRNTIKVLKRLSNKIEQAEISKEQIALSGGEPSGQGATMLYEQEVLGGWKSIMRLNSIEDKIKKFESELLSRTTN